MSTHSMRRWPSASPVARALTLGALGMSLVIAGARRRRRVGGLVVALLGTVLLARGASSALYAGRDRSRRPRGIERPPVERRFGAGERDLVDEASWESFPASDPPGYR